MLVLFETPAGYALFKMNDESKLEDADNVFKYFTTPDVANKTVKLKAFSKFENTTDALSAVTALVEGKLSKSLKKFLTDELSEKDLKEKLAVGDSKLASSIAKKFSINVVSDSATNELMRGIRTQLTSLITGIPEADMNAMVLGLSHSLSRYKLKFSPDKVDTMIIQAIHLLDDLDKELNTYAMRVKEWYGWHFPEMTKIIVDNQAYAKVVKAMGFRTNASSTDLSTILPEELEKEVKDAAEISMGTEISDEDIENITHLCEQIISISDYRTQLYDYLKNRMAAIAPNLTCLVGELVGARLIAHSGSLLNLSKQPASTIQILGAEKALFRALKSKHDTPKYGLLYHASLVGQAGPKIKGKMARTVATKAALAIRVDALGESLESPEVGLELRAKVEDRLRQLEGKAKTGAVTSAGKGKQQKKFEFAKPKAYNPASDVVATTQKRKADDGEDDDDESEEEKPKEKKGKKAKKAADDEEGGDEEKPKKKKAKKAADDEEGEDEEKPKKKKKKADADEEDEDEEKPKKKKKKAADDDEEAKPKKKKKAKTDA
ncbi:Nucleolar protein 58 [Blyttiomyces sp. JEL0837]|nr:Nucleolar protein 58 [Blyttiomyces sp. JEL0837]